MVDRLAEPQSVQKVPRLSEAERKKEQLRVLKDSPYRDEFWIFGFGSLMWRPGFEFQGRYGATLNRYERKFQIWSTVGRGTPKNPGLGCCLMPGPGSCRGVALSLNTENLNADLDYLWGREMGSGVYRPTWVEVELDDGKVKKALTFVIRSGHIQYTGPLSATRMAEIIGSAKGENGSCREYLAKTLEEMSKLGEHDRLLIDVMKRIEAAGKNMC